MHKKILIMFIMLLLAFTMTTSGCTYLKKPQFDLRGNVEESWVDVNRSYTQGDIVKVDDNGNIYVATGITIIKYDTNGKKLWSNEYPYGGGWGMILDKNGNGYTAGHNITKFSSDGKELWMRRFQDEASTDGQAYKIVEDDENNVVAAGTLSYGDTKKCAVIKYSDTGNVIWSATFADGSTSVTDLPFSAFWEAVAIDKTGNIVATGYAGTVKYSRDGKQLWVGARDGKGAAVAIDDSGNIYVTGSYGTIKYDEKGNVLWSNSEEGFAIAIDNSGYIYTSYPYDNYTEGKTPWADYIEGKTIKYDSNGQVIWARDYGGSFISIDKSGGVYVPNGGVDSPTIFKLDSDGNVKWTASIFQSGGGGNLNDLAVDKFGNVFVTGYLSVTHRFDDWSSNAYVTVKYSQK